MLRAKDIYKLVHQGVYGPGHIISSAAAAHKALTCELAAFRASSPKDKGRSQEELAVEPIDPDGRLVRVNLRPFSRSAEVRSQHCQTGAAEANAESRRQKYGLEWLVEAMIESAARVKGDPRIVKRRLAAAVRWCRTNLPRQAAELERMAARGEESGYPAFHHSSAYARAYRPSYRVVLGSLLDHGPVPLVLTAARPLEFLRGKYKGQSLKD